MGGVGLETFTYMGVGGWLMIFLFGGRWIEVKKFRGGGNFSLLAITGRRHSETISCGMCNFEANQIETLDTHTFTCEMYKCNECEISFLHLD